MTESYDYRIIRGASIFELEDKVKHVVCDEGYGLVGGVTVVRWGRESAFYQAVQRSGDCTKWESNFKNKRYGGH